MAGATFTYPRLPSPAGTRIQKWAFSQTPPVALPILVAGGKGFRQLLKQKQQHKGKAQEGSASSLSPSRGFAGKKILRKESEPKSQHQAVAADSLEEHTICPCGGRDENLSYSECCMPFHQGAASAPDALTLLRARYSAFARGIVGYIVSTTHPESPDNGDNLPANAQTTCDQLRFHKLEIMHYEQVSDQKSNISYRVIYGRRERGHGERKSLEEKSLFVREGDTWLFQDGEVLRRSSESELESASTISTGVKS